MNCDIQTVIVKANSSKESVKLSRHTKRHLKSFGKLRNFEVITITYIQTNKKPNSSLYKETITKYEIECIDEDVYETGEYYTIVVTKNL